MFKKIPSITYAFSELGVKLHDGVSSIIAFDKSSVQLGTPIIFPLSGTGAGEPLAEAKLSPSRMYQLDFGLIKQPKYQGMLLPTVHLAEFPLIVGVAPAIVYGQESRLLLTILPTKQIQLADLIAHPVASLFLAD